MFEKLFKKEYKPDEEIAILKDKIAELRIINNVLIDERDRARDAANYFEARYRGTLPTPGATSFPIPYPTALTGLMSGGYASMPITQIIKGLDLPIEEEEPQEPKPVIKRDFWSMPDVPKSVEEIVNPNFKNELDL